jgi:hydroxymethylbilane synthase
MSMNKRIRIGTRDSALALYQALEVQKRINQIGIETEIVEISSDGDLDLVAPLYEMGIQGIFTKSLDAALLENKIDVAVHSCKDVPTKLAKGLILPAVLERGSPMDCLVLPAGNKSFDFGQTNTIATSSLRRKLQWLNRFPNHGIENLRGNIQTRLKKLDQTGWQGAIFAQAALERLGISSHQVISLDWMLPSPAQGAIAVVCRQGDTHIRAICDSIDHTNTHVCVQAERDFLAKLHGGCAVPIAAHAQVQAGKIWFRGNVMTLDAKEKFEVELTLGLDQALNAGVLAAEQIRKQGVDRVINTFRSFA